MTAPAHIGLVAVGGAGWMGGANYVRNLALALRAAAPETQVSFVCGSPLLPDWRTETPLLNVPVNPSIIDRIFGRTRSLRETLDQAGVDFLYPLTYDNAYNLGIDFPIAPQLGYRKWAGWIPDFQHRHLPELFSAEEIASRDRRIGELIAEAPCVVFSSQSAAADFRRFYPEHSCRIEVLSFTTPPIEVVDDPSDVESAPPRFFLVCNQFWKHKNHLLIFEALRLLAARGLRPRVLCTGQLDDYRDRSFAAKIHAALAADGLGEHVSLLGLIPRARQVTLMRRAIAVIQPSLFEGWSTVVEDARALGRPCLLSDLDVHREQQPPGARYFDPHDAEALAALLAETWEHWPTGPDIAAEESARAAAKIRLATVGERLLAIRRGITRSETSSLRSS